MRKLAILLLCGWAPAASAQLVNNQLLYEGFDYPDGAALAPTAVSGDQNDPANQGQLNPTSGTYWFPAGTGIQPVVATGNVWFDNSMPAPTGNSAGMTNGGNGTSARIEIPNRPTMPSDGSGLTFYWSGFFRLDRLLDDLGSGLASAPSGRTAGEGGVFIAGFNNTPGPQTGTISAVGGTLLLKRASANPDSPLADNYYIGTQTNSRDACNPANNFDCSDRNFADYDPTKDPTVTPGADRSELPSVYWEESARAATRAKYPAVPIGVGETVFVVGAHTVVPGTQNDVARIWINPDPSSFGSLTPPLPEPGSFVNSAACPAGAVSCGFVESPTISGTDIVIAGGGVPAPETPASVATFFLRMAGPSPAESYLDEVRVGLTWASVTGVDVMPPGLTGDYNEDGKVDAADYVLWRKNDINGQQGYDDWRANFGATAPGGGGLAAAVPEPATVSLLIITAFAALRGSRSSRGTRGNCLA